MINVDVFSEEKAWSKKLKDKESFFKKICQAFPKKYKFPKKEISFSLLLSNNLNIKKVIYQDSLNNKYKLLSFLSGTDVMYVNGGYKLPLQN